MRAYSKHYDSLEKNRRRKKLRCEDWVLRNLERVKTKAKLNRDSRREARLEYKKKWQAALKLEMVVAYGGKCYCCAELEIAFLSIDHTFGDGIKDRILFGSGNVFYAHLKRKGWPKDRYRLSCMNCQFGTRYGRTCPHKIVRRNSYENAVTE